MQKFQDKKSYLTPNIVVSGQQKHLTLCFSLTGVDLASPLRAFPFSGVFS
jgi:hypothetical protein